MYAKNKTATTNGNNRKLHIIYIFIITVIHFSYLLALLLAYFLEQRYAIREWNHVLAREWAKQKSDYWWYALQIKSFFRFIRTLRCRAPLHLSYRINCIAYNVAATIFGKYELQVVGEMFWGGYEQHIMSHIRTKKSNNLLSVGHFTLERTLDCFHQVFVGLGYLYIYLWNYDIYHENYLGWIILEHKSLFDYY